MSSEARPKSLVEGTPSSAAPSAVDAGGAHEGADEDLGDIDLDIRPGEFVVFLGPSAAGAEARLLYLISGLEEAIEGQISRSRPRRDAVALTAA